MKYKRVLKEIKVGETWNCPFRREETVQLGGMTCDVNMYCNLKDRAGYSETYCWENKCPLKNRKRIVVEW